LDEDERRLTLDQDSKECSGWLVRGLGPGGGLAADRGNDLFTQRLRAHVGNMERTALAVAFKYVITTCFFRLYLSASAVLLLAADKRFVGSVSRASSMGSTPR
jgi:hypothetical protein